MNSMIRVPDHSRERSPDQTNPFPIAFDIWPCVWFRSQRHKSPHTLLCPPGGMQRPMRSIIGQEEKKGI